MQHYPHAMPPLSPGRARWRRRLTWLAKSLGLLLILWCTATALWRETHPRPTPLDRHIQSRFLREEWVPELDATILPLSARREVLLHLLDNPSLWFQPRAIVSGHVSIVLALIGGDLELRRLTIDQFVAPALHNPPSSAWQQAALLVLAVRLEHASSARESLMHSCITGSLQTQYKLSQLLTAPIRLHEMLSQLNQTLRQYYPEIRSIGKLTDSDTTRHAEDLLEPYQDFVEHEAIRWDPAMGWDYERYHSLWKFHTQVLKGPPPPWPSTDALSHILDQTLAEALALMLANREDKEARWAGEALSRCAPRSSERVTQLLPLLADYRNSPDYLVKPHMELMARLCPEDDDRARAGILEIVANLPKSSFYRMHDLNNTLSDLPKRQKALLDADLRRLAAERRNFHLGQLVGWEADSLSAAEEAAILATYANTDPVKIDHWTRQRWGRLESRVLANHFLPLAVARWRSACWEVPSSFGGISGYDGSDARAVGALFTLADPAIARSQALLLLEDFAQATDPASAFWAVAPFWVTYSTLDPSVAAWFWPIWSHLADTWISRLSESDLGLSHNMCWGIPQTLLDQAADDLLLRRQGPLGLSVARKLAAAQGQLLPEAEWHRLLEEAGDFLRAHPDATLHMAVRLRLVRPWMRQEPKRVHSLLYAMPPWNDDGLEEEFAAALLVPLVAPESLQACLDALRQPGRPWHPDKEKLELWLGTPGAQPGSLPWFLTFHNRSNYSTLHSERRFFRNYWPGAFPAWQSVHARHLVQPGWCWDLRAVQAIHGQDGYLQRAMARMFYNTDPKADAEPTVQLYYNLWLAGEKPPVRAR